MAINQQTLEGRWSEVRGKVHERWGDISENELEETQGDVDQLVGLIERKTGEARETVESYLESAAESGSAAAADAANSMRERAHQAILAAERAAVGAREALRSGVEGTERVLRRHPYESLAVTFGMGVLSGVFLGMATRSK